MRKLIIAALVALLPLSGFAQQVKEAPQTAVVSALMGVSTERVVAIGFGVLGGALGLHTLLGDAAWTLAGAAAGAMFGNWWYIQRLDTKRTSAKLAPG
ncbi:MAG: hypothetical protein WCJ64_15715 [Rhodospirillaceae bacterium]